MKRNVVLWIIGLLVILIAIFLFNGNKIFQYLGTITTGKSVPKVSQKSKTIPPSFSLSYFDNTGKLNIRYSFNGETWESGTVEGDYRGLIGPGTGGDPSGILRLHTWPDPSKGIMGVLGIGAMLTGKPDQLTSERPLSAPSIVYLANNDLCWIMAYQNSARRISVRGFNSHLHQISDIDYAPGHPNNNNVSGRPALAIMGNELLLAWNVANQGISIAKGHIDNHRIVWDGFYDSTSLPFSRSISDPALSNDHRQFYLAINLASQTGQQNALIYVSPNGKSWSHLTTKPNIVPRSVIVPTPTICLAVSPDLGILLIVYNLNPSVKLFSIYQQGQWIDRNSNCFDSPPFLLAPQMSLFTNIGYTK
jgi:hypothetical protein